MELSKYVTGIQHIGLPTRDMAKTLEFYKRLGFSVVKSYERGTLEKPKQLNFLQLKNVVIETFEKPDAAGVPGAIDHIALDVTNIDAQFAAVKSAGFQMLDDSIQFLPFWEKGVKFFTIQGPNGEKIEFSQIL